MRCSGKHERGAAAVEFALLLPVLLLLVVGIMEFGRAWYTQATLAGAAREAVREMAIHGPANATSEAVNYSTGLGVTAGMVAISPGTCPSTGNTDVTVTITYPYTYLTGLIPGGGLTLRGMGKMRCNG